MELVSLSICAPVAWTGQQLPQAAWPGNAGRVLFSTAFLTALGLVAAYMLSPVAASRGCALPISGLPALQ